MMKISVIVAAYNVENYIEKCLNSIVSQTYRNLEIIVVNDGSTDRTLDKISNFAKFDNRMIIINKPNGGLSSARNAGIDCASGDYIGFIDGDDYIAEDMYETLLEQMLKHHCEISMCAVLKVYNSYKENDCFRAESLVLNKTEALQALVEEEYVKHYAWNKLYEANLFNTVRYPEGKIYEDLFTTFKLFGLANRIAYTNKIGYNYVQREGSILRSKFDGRKLDCIMAFKEFKAYVDENHPELSRQLVWRINLSTINSLLDMLKSEALYSNCHFKEMGANLNRNVKNNLFFYLTGANIPLTYKILSILSIGGYPFVRRLFKTAAIKRFVRKKATDLA